MIIYNKYIQNNSSNYLKAIQQMHFKISLVKT